MPTEQTDLIASFAERAKRLHTPRCVAMAVLELTQHPQVSAALLTEEIQTDPALTARILRVVNSPMFAARGDIVNLEQAIAMLGVKTLRMLALGFALPDSLVQSEHVEAMEAYWRYAFIKSTSAKALAEIVWKRAGDQAFIAGLLHDLGALVLLQELGGEYAQLVCKAYSEGTELNRIEKGLLGFEHPALSAQLLCHWGVPASLTDPIGARMQVDSMLNLPDEHRDLAQIIHLSELLAKFLLRKDASALREFLTVARRYKNVHVSHLERVIRQVQELEPVMAEAFSQPQVDGDYIESLELARRELQSLGEPGEELFKVNEVEGFEQLAELIQQLTESLETAEASGGECAPADTERGANPHRKALHQRRRDDTGCRGFETDNGSACSAPEVCENEAVGGASNEYNTDQWSEERLAFDHREAMVNLNQCLSRSRRTRTPVSLILFDIDLDLADFGTARAMHREIRELIADRFASVASQTSGGRGVSTNSLQRSNQSQAAHCGNLSARSHYVARIERMASVKLARDILSGIESMELGEAATIKIAIASIDRSPPNFPVQVWWDAAQRCLYGAKCAGGNTIKSIDVV
jgi:HD-like signal output (HDOD) protein